MRDSHGRSATEDASGGGGPAAWLANREPRAAPTRATRASAMADMRCGSEAARRSQQPPATARASSGWTRRPTLGRRSSGDVMRSPAEGVQAATRLSPQSGVGGAGAVTPPPWLSRRRVHRSVDRDATAVSCQGLTDLPRGAPVPRCTSMCVLVCVLCACCVHVRVGAGGCEW